MPRSRSGKALRLVVSATVMAMSGTAARAGVLEPELAVDGGTGVPGGTVSVTLSLADDPAGAGVSAGVDVNFAAESLQFFEPVDDNCALAERISTTHGVAGRLLGPDDGPPLNLEVFVLGNPSPPLPPLGNGELVTCDFRIKPGVPVGTVSLEIDAPVLGNAHGTPIPVRVRNGSVQVVAELPTATPTPSPTPQLTDTSTPKATATDTVAVTATATGTPNTPTATSTSSTPGSPTSTATATATSSTPPPTSIATTTATSIATTTATSSTPLSTATATATRTGGGPTVTKTAQKGADDDSCNIARPDPSATPGATVLLLLPALLLWMRRRQQ